MSSDDCSLFGHLTKLTDNNEATDFSRLLIRVVAYNACSARRNTLTTYRLVETLRNVSNEIGALITKVDGITDVNDWEAYDTYTAAIDPLETFLYDLLHFTDEVEFQEFLGKTATVLEVTTSVATWEASREKLRKFVQDVIATPEFDFVFQNLPVSESEVGFEEKHDDLAFLSALCKGINKHALKDEDIVGGKTSKSISSVKRTAVDIAQGAKSIPSNDSIFQSIRCTMLVHGAMVLSQTEAKVKGSAPVWNKARELLEKVKSHLSTQSQKDVPEAELKKGWDELKQLLENLGAVLPEGYLALRNLAKNIRRPYHAQALALIAMCKDLAVEFQKEGNNIAGNLGQLQAALTAGSKALDNAKKAPLDIAGDDFKVTNNEFTEAAKKVDECRTAYKGDFILHPPNQGSLDMQAALAKDSKWVESLNKLGVDKLKKKEVVPKKALVEVNVSYTPGATLKKKKYKVDATTRLSVILWKLISEQSDPFPRDKILGACFEKTNGGEKLAFDDEVGSSKLDLTLKTGEIRG